jgi:hypothetical protein
LLLLMLAAVCVVFLRDFYVKSELGSIARKIILFKKRGGIIIYLQSVVLVLVTCLYRGISKSQPN